MLEVCSAGGAGSEAALATRRAIPVGEQKGVDIRFSVGTKSRVSPKGAGVLAVLSAGPSQSIVDGDSLTDGGERLELSLAFRADSSPAVSLAEINSTGQRRSLLDESGLDCRPAGERTLYDVNLTYAGDGAWSLAVTDDGGQSCSNVSSRSTNRNHDLSLHAMRNAAMRLSGRHELPGGPCLLFDDVAVRAVAR